MDIKLFQEIIGFAIEKESETEAFYENLSNIVEKPQSVIVLRELAAEERRHRQFLEELDISKISEMAIKEIPDLKISEFLPEVTFSADIEYRDILVMAIKAEEKSHRLYKTMARQYQDPELRKLFELLAQEEAKHKLKLETEYDEYVLKED